ncbi:lambda-crystallin homolog [Anneissia japonica]|uniref:lambda-crystallin homolog n=1 Tax=Anneissia japonica TaxID=1529436 RepID=UPI0014259372|nr:lambda-crystallin homolog [Anneissia japonica]
MSSEVTSALDDIETQLYAAKQSGLLRGTLSAEEQFKLITGSNDLVEAVKGAKHIQECVPEILDLKKAVFKNLDKCVDETAVISSSTSCLAPSLFTEELSKRDHCIVCHPVNPPYYVPLVEIIPSSWTDKFTMDRTRALMEEIGQVPVLVKKELPGFALNRIQYAIIGECWRLVQEGVMSTEDVDKVMSAGLGPRYAFMGPLEVMHLNAEGMQSYIDRYAKSMTTVSSTFGPAPTFDGAALNEIVKDMNTQIPLVNLDERRQWRDARLLGLAKLKKDMDSEQK